MSTYILNGSTTIGDTTADTTIFGFVRVGGTSNTITLTSTNPISIGGTSRTLTIAGDGDVGISSSGTIGSASSDVNLVLVGGSNTTLYGSGSISIGPSSSTVRFQPTNPKLFLKDNPVITKKSTSYSYGPPE